MITIYSEDIFRYDFEYQREWEDNKTTKQYEDLIEDGSITHIDFRCKHCGSTHMYLEFHLQGDLRYKSRCPRTNMLVYEKAIVTSNKSIAWLI